MSQAKDSRNRLPRAPWVRALFAIAFVVLLAVATRQATAAPGPAPQATNSEEQATAPGAVRDVAALLEIYRGKAPAPWGSNLLAFARATAPTDWVAYRRTAGGEQPRSGQRGSAIDNDGSNKTILLRLRLSTAGYRAPAILIGRNVFAWHCQSDRGFSYTAGSPDTFAPGRFLGWNWHLLEVGLPPGVVSGGPAPAVDQAHTLYLQIYRPLDLTMPAISLGENHNVLKDAMLGGLPLLFVSALSLFLAVLYLVAFAMRSQEGVFLSIAFFYTTIGVWLLSINFIFPFFVSEAIWRNRIEYAALFLAPAGIFAFAEYGIGSGWTFLLRAGRYIFVIYAAGVFALDSLGIVPLWKTLLPFQIGMLGGIAVFTAYLIKAARGGSVEARIVSVGVIVLAITSVHDIAMASGVISSFGFLVHVGVLSLILALSLVIASRVRGLYSRIKDFSEEMKVKNEELLEVNRLKDEFLANTSHELRTPLTGITGLAESLLEGAAGTLSTRVRENLAMIVTSGRRLAGLVNDILDAARLRRSDLQLGLRNIDLAGVVRLAVQLSSPLIGSRPIEMRQELPDGVLGVRADENRLQQILLNLLGNAIKFTESGSVTLKVSKRGDQVRLSVIDTGPGIPPEKQERIFEAFEQADGSTARRYGGTGLGLSITRDLVRLHGSQLHLESQVGSGSHFYFDLPAAGTVEPSDSGGLQSISAWSAAELTETSVATGGAALTGTRVLVVDDEPINRQVLRNQLQLHGHTVIVTDSGSAALAEISAQKPDLVILDVMMPGLTGYETCQSIRTEYSADDLPVILLTAKNQISDLVNGFDVGANDYLTKPFLAGELRKRVEFHLSLARVSAQLRLLNQELENKVLQRTESLNTAMVQLQDNEREFQNELEIAAHIQSNLLLSLPLERPGFSMHGFYRPLRKVSGDFYDCVTMDSGESAVLIGDVTGHGVPAALLMTMMRLVFRDAVDRFLDGPDILMAMNNVIEKNLASSGHFLTACLLLIDPSGRVRFCNAGHNPPLLRRAEGAVETIDGEGAMLGIASVLATAYEEKILQMQKGDRWLLYTDGIVEFKRADKELFGPERLRSFFENFHGNPAEIEHTLMAQLATFSSQAQATDDITCLLLDFG